MNERMETTGTLVIGIGNDFRGDDAAGLIAARALRSCVFSGPPHFPVTSTFEIRESDGSAFSLMDLWRGRDRVVVIDALATECRPTGEVLILDGLRQTLPQDSFVLSTHAFGLKEAIDLSRSLSCLPGELIIVGVVGKNFAMDDQISSEVTDAVHRLVLEWPHCLEGDVKTTPPVREPNFSGEDESCTKCR